MSTRRRNWLWRAAIGAALAGSGAGGCAQQAGVAAEKPAADSTESKVARSADAMKRFLEGGTAEQPGKSAGDAASTTVKDTGAVAPPSQVHTPNAPAPSPTLSAGQPANIVQPAPAPASPVAAPVVTTAPAAPVTAQSAPAPSRNDGPLSGFFSGDAVDNGQNTAPAKGPSLRISALAVCSKVEGFGRFTRMENARITGKPVPMLVYTQVDGFAHRTLGGAANAPAAEDGKTQWVVDLGQTVVVYRLGADGKEPDEQVLYIPEQPCRDVATGKRRDHFLVQRIDLSPWLVAGKYSVKVVLRDKATGQVDERLTEVTLK